MDLNIAFATSVSFGPFRLFPSRRLLLDGDQPLCLGSRAFDILIALVERTGELVDKKDLMRRVWPDTNVVENNLFVHVAALRRALRDGTDGNRYIVTIPGRGYCFAAPTVEMVSPPSGAVVNLARRNLRDTLAWFSDRAPDTTEPESNPRLDRDGQFVRRAH